MNQNTAHAEEAPQAPPFGTVFTDRMIMTRCQNGVWSAAEDVAVEPLSLHPASHVLHYASTCFEGLKAFRMDSGEIRIFRLDRHLARLQQSAELLCLPCPDTATVEEMIRKAVAMAENEVPDPPGALYLRPTLFGTEPNIGAAAAPSGDAMFYVLAAPVGEYFRGGMRPLRILVEDQDMRSTPGFGRAKTGGNYAAALRSVLRAKKAHNVDQVLYCPGGDVQETGAANFLLINDRQVMTKSLDDSFLHGVTRDSVLRLAERLGYEVIERPFSVGEMMDWIQTGEAALSGTAAVLAPIGQMVYQGREYAVGDGNVGANTTRLRDALTDIQCGKADDPDGWLS